MGAGVEASVVWLAAMDAWSWGLLGGGAVCSGLCLALCVVTVAVMVWRASKRKGREAEVEVESEGPVLPLDPPAQLTGPFGYVRTGDFEYSRERWGRPLTYRCTLADGAAWRADAFGRRICIREHSIRAAPPSGLSLAETGDGALDLRFATFTEAPEDARLLADPELRARLLAVSWLLVEADGEFVEMRDTRRRAVATALEGLSPDSPAGIAAKVQLHDDVADVLVMLADRLS